MDRIIKNKQDFMKLVFSCFSTDADSTLKHGIRKHQTHTVCTWNTYSLLPLEDEGTMSLIQLFFYETTDLVANCEARKKAATSIWKYIETFFLNL